MTKSRTLLAAAFATLALGAGTAFAGSEQYPAGPALLTYSAEVAGGAGVVARSVSDGSTAQLSALLRDWDRAGFSAPSKPGQASVHGRNGYVTTGPGYNAMVSLIRSAVRNTVEGRDGEALASIVQARNLLHGLDRASAAPAPRLAMSAN